MRRRYNAHMIPRLIGTSVTAMPHMDTRYGAESIAMYLLRAVPYTTKVELMNMGILAEGWADRAAKIEGKYNRPMHPGDPGSE